MVETAIHHPIAPVPATLFDDPEAEKHWRQRFSAVRVSLPEPARDAVDHAVYVSNDTGRFEVTCWDITTERRVIATDRPDGTVHALLSADGRTLWWFDDDAGDEFGCWRVQPFGSAPSSDPVAALPDIPRGYSAGLEVGTSVILAGFADDDGTRIHLSVGGGMPRIVYRHAEDAAVGALSTDETIWVLSHSEHGDSRYHALRAFSLSDNNVIGELSDIPGKGLTAVAFSPIPGDQRLLVGHERRGRDELLIWDLGTGTVRELPINLPGDLDADFYPDASALILVHTYAARTTVHRYDLESGVVTDLPVTVGVVSGARARPGGSVWYRWSSAASPSQLRVLHPDGVDEVLLETSGEPASGSQALRDLWVPGPGGTIHALLALPEQVGDGAKDRGPWPTVVAVHGGPTASDEDAFDAVRATWLDAGYAVVHVNYRGSTGYGAAWRDAHTARIGHTELTDIAAVHDHLVSAGVIDPVRSVIAGYSWGGDLALLALGTQPDRWAAGVAGVPVADYVAAYEDEMEPLRAYDRALFGGSPTDMPHAYRDSSPLTYVDRVRAPVLVLAGENDPRCPIRQIDTYLDALAACGASYAVYRYDAGHGSLVIDERLRQMACEVAFVRAVVPASRPAQ